eukprot:m.117971 g.117971  ORF g.117971 m.117971 type:complete len:116 (+) comp51987_c0_seq11:447-794(+)
MAMTGNLASWSSSQSDAWYYDFGKVSLGASTIYTYTIVVPLLLWGYLKWKGPVALSLFDLFSLYGYSLTAFVPAAILCALPVGNIGRWIFVLIAFALSGSAGRTVSTSFHPSTFC